MIAEDYEAPFTRNLGWITEEESKTLHSKRVAIAGLGGVGGSHLLNLVRLGVGEFSLADFDVFETANLNRQVGAYQSTCGKKKLDVMCELSLDINPYLKFQKFSEGIRESNIHKFLEGADLFIDGLDIFAMDLREKIFSECYKKGIPAITAAPIGTGSATMIFLPGGTTFQNYFRLEGYSLECKVLKFLLGMTPSLMQSKYLVDKKFFDLRSQKTPSTIMGCGVASGIAATLAMKILLGRGVLSPAPWTFHFDPFLGRLKKKYMWGGARNPFFKLRFFALRRFLDLI